MLFVGFLLVGFVAAQSSRCQKVTGSDLPACTNTCLLGKEADATCGNDLVSFCQLSGGIGTYFATWGDCLLKSCGADADRYDFINAFKHECGNLFTGEPDAWKKYRTLPTKAVMTTVLAATSALSSATSAQNSPPPAPSSVNSSPLPSSDPVKPPQETKTSVVAPQPNDSQGPGNQPQVSTVHVHVTISGAQPSSTSSTTNSTAGAATSMNKGQVIGSAAGGTAAIATLIGAVYLFMRRRRRLNSQPSTPNMWSPDRNAIHKTEMTGTVFEKHSETGSGGVVGPAELHSSSVSPMSNDRPMNERYPTLNARSLTKSSGVAGDARYYSPTTQSELDAIALPHRVSELDTLSPLTSRSPVSETSTMNAWHAPPMSPLMSTHHAELDVDRIASPVSDVGGSVISGTHPAELHGEAAPPRYADLRGVGGLMEGSGEQRVQEQQNYVAYSPGAAGMARNF